jgi:hypothetical protein
MHYTCHVNLDFSSVEHIMRDVEGGWARGIVCVSACNSVVGLSGSVRQYAQCGSVRLPGSAAVCSRAAVCIFSNIKYKIYLYKFV